MNSPASATRALFATFALMTGVAASVQAQPKDFTLYGTVDLAVRRSSGLTPEHIPSRASHTGLSSGVADTSHWGVRGITPLGNSESVVFQLESGLRADTGSSEDSGTYFNRSSWIGLQAPWGRLTAGRHDTLLAQSLLSIDPLARRMPDLNPNVTIAALGMHGLPGDFGNTGTAGSAYRLNDSLLYTGRSGAYTTGIMYGFGEQAGGHSRSASAGLSLMWEEDGATLGGAYQRFKDADGRALNAWIIGTAYRSGNVRIAASAARQDADTGAAERTRQHVYSLGTTWSPTQQSDWTLAYYRVTREQPFASTTEKDGFQRFVLLAQYRLSQRTRLYSAFDLTQWRHGYQGLGNKRRANGISVGMQYRF